MIAVTDSAPSGQTESNPPLQAYLGPDYRPLSGAERKRRTQFTPERARQMAVLAVAAKRRKAEERLRRLNEPEPEPVKPAEYVTSQLVCIRAQIDKLNRAIMRMVDAKKLHWLCGAVAKLREQERILDGRPLPGQLRPSGAKPRKSGNIVQPIEDSPVP